MRRLRLVILIGIFAVAGCGRPSAREVASQSRGSETVDLIEGPIAEFETLSADLGEIALKSMSDTRQVRFKVRNAGTQTLKINELRLSCGCTTGKVLRSELPPGESGGISVVASLGVPGLKTVGANVFSNCVKNPAVGLRIRWNAIAPILVEPEEVDFGRVLMGEKRSRQVRLLRSAGGECPASQLSVDVPHGIPGLAATLDNDVVTVRLTAGGAPGRQRKFLQVKLADCWRESIRIPVVWEVVPRITVVPSSIHVGSVPPGHPISRKIVVRSNDGQPLPESDSVSIETVGSHVTISWASLSRDVRSGTITFNAPVTNGPFHWMIPLLKGKEVDAPIEVSVSGFVIP